MTNKETYPQCFQIVHTDKFFPEADKWMWDYCTFLGKFVCSKGIKYDLGILEDQKTGPCDATVFGNVDGNYSSGEISEMFIDFAIESNNESYLEMIRRARILKIINV